jgi:protease I
MKIACIPVLFLLAIPAMAAEEGGAMPVLNGRKVVMVIASQDFRDEEFFVPRDLLTKAGATVVVASSTTNEVRGMLGRRVKPDVLLASVSGKDVDGVVFVGGSGAREYFTNAVAHKVAIDASVAGKVVAAICVAPVILANAGLLKERKATCFPSERSKLEKGGATVQDVTVVRHGNVVTACGPEAADDFARALVSALAVKPAPPAGAAPGGGT